MKVFIMAALLIFIIGNIWAADTDSYQFVDHLRVISEAQSPEIYEDAVLFTASSSYNRVGISFAHDGYSKVHWLKRFRIPKDRSELFINGKFQRKMDRFEDAGIFFHLEPIPASLESMDYRMIIDGLWTTDPLNPNRVTGPTGVIESRFPLPLKSKTQVDIPLPGTYRFIYHASPGEIITVGGSFNNWDPFMFELKETSPGYYSLSIPLPIGRFQYVFFHRGEQVIDPLNPRILYSREGRMVSEAIVER